MACKIYTSDITWRTQQQQLDAISSKYDDAKVYHGENELVNMLRPTQRREDLTIVVASLAVLAKTEVAFRNFLKLARSRNCWIISCEEDYLVRYGKYYSAARKHSAAKAGARNSADKKKARSAISIARIKDRWPLSSKEWPTKTLLDEAGVSLNTAKSILGKRPIAQYNHQAKEKRKARKNAR